MKASEYVIANHPDPDSLADTGDKWASIFEMMEGYASQLADKQSIEFATWYSGMARHKG
jgi:hypothetical protein